MTKDLELAKQTLNEGGYTLVIVNDGEVILSNERGVGFLLSLTEKGFRCGFSAADKVVGKGAGFLYVYLKAKAVYASVISKCAKELMESNGIEVFADTVCEYIVNRKGDGRCPIELAVLDTTDPKTAINKIKSALKELRAQ